MTTTRERALEAALHAVLDVNDKRRHPLGAPDEGIAHAYADAAAKARAALALPSTPDVNADMLAALRDAECELFYASTGAVHPIGVQQALTSVRNAMKCAARAES